MVRGAIASYYSSTATLEPDKQADVQARVSGLVLSLEAEEGDHVAQGATLLTIEDDEYRHRLKQAEAQEDLQRSRFARLKQMFERDLTSTEEYETARSNLQTAEAAKDLAALECSHTRVCAPFAGRVVARAVDPGQMVTVGTRLFTLADTQRLLARAHVPAKEFRRIHTTQPVELTLDSTHEALCGQITLISPIIDPTSGTIKVTVEINDYPASIRPGDFAMVRIVTDRHEAALLVPKIAVFSDKGQEVVYVVADSTAQRRPVETGFRSDEQIEITGGVVEGESVVVQGQRSLEDGQRVKISPPGGSADDRAGSRRLRRRGLPAPATRSHARYQLSLADCPDRILRYGPRRGREPSHPPSRGDGGCCQGAAHHPFGLATWGLGGHPGIRLGR